jgi:hypothetical protein
VWSRVWIKHAVSMNPGQLSVNFEARKPLSVIAEA